MRNIEAVLGSPQDVEHRAAQHKAAKFEMFLAQTCTRSYVAGLEIGTRLVNPDAKGKIDEYDGGAGRYGYENLPMGSLEYTVLGQELTEEEGERAIMALQAGVRAAHQHPIEQFKTQGVPA